MISRMYVSAALIAAVCSMQSVPSWAKNGEALYEQAIKAQDGDPSGDTGIDLKGAQELLIQAAGEGSALAMQRLGDMYHDGDGGVKRNYETAVEWYQKEAALEDSHPGSGALGMVALGEMYEKGRGVASDKTQAEEWFKKARASGKAGADKGDTLAMIALAYCDAQGKGVAGAVPDPVSAWAWVIKASKTPNPWAYELMASLYARGVGVKADDAMALSYLFKAAQMGISRDMVDVSLSFAGGRGIKQDSKAAKEWIDKAVKRGNSRAMGILGKYWNEGIGVERRSDTTAKECYEKAIAQGDESALGFMGDMLVAPGVNPRDAVGAVAWFEKGAQAKDPYSMYRLAYMVSYDPDILPDINRAQELLGQAANLGYVEAITAMGELYRNGKLRGTRNDAIAQFRKAAEAGSISGMRNLGELLTIEADGSNPYKSADDNKQLMAEAYDWLKKAADAGDPEALADVGDAFARGKGPSVSPGTAIKWYLKAANAGSVRGMRNLGEIYLHNTVLADYGEAKKWYEKAIAKDNDAASLAGLAEIYDNALGVPEDNITARDLYMAAMKGGAAGGYRGLAKYSADWGDYKKAAQYYEEAARLGDIRAKEALGRMYELGQGVDKNPARAMQLFQEASDMGSLSAWSWVFSHTNFSATGPSATMSSRMPPPLDLPELAPSTAPGGRGPGGFGPGRGGPGGPGGAGGGPAGGRQ